MQPLERHVNEVRIGQVKMGEWGVSPRGESKCKGPEP